MIGRLVVVALLVLALIPTAGCGGKDELESKAPPPSAEAVQKGLEPTVQKNMPGPNSTTGGPGGSGVQGAAAKPAGM